MTSEAEQKDLDEMKKKVSEEHDLAFMMFRQILRASSEDLKHMGFKTKEAALLWNVEQSVKKCELLAKAHVKKWPDER